MDEIDQTLPPFVQAMLRDGAVLEPIRLDRHGRWWHRGNLIEHRRIAALFSRCIGRTAGGTWVLEVGRYTYPVEVDDTPLFVRRWRRRAGQPDGADQVELELSDGSTRPLDTATLQHADDGLYVGGLALGAAHEAEARFLLEPYVDFVEAFVEPAEGSGEASDADFVVRLSDGRRQPLERRAPLARRAV